MDKTHNIATASAAPKAGNPQGQSYGQHNIRPLRMALSGAIIIVSFFSTVLLFYAVLFGGGTGARPDIKPLPAVISQYSAQ